MGSTKSGLDQIWLDQIWVGPNLGWIKYGGPNWFRHFCLDQIWGVIKKITRHFYTPSILTFMNFYQLKTTFPNRKQQKTTLVTLFGPLAAILKFALKCKQTAISQELSMVNKFCLHIFYIIKCLNCWDNKKFWGSKSGPPSPATSVNIYVSLGYCLISSSRFR